MFLSSSGQIPEALRLRARAIARDPHYAPALAWAAPCCHRLLLDGRSEDREAGNQLGGKTMTDLRVATITGEEATLAFTRDVSVALGHPRPIPLSVNLQMQS
jgi:hypothetical protein